MQLIASFAKGAVAAGLTFCGLSVATQTADLYGTHRRLCAEEQNMPVLMVDEDILIDKTRVFGQDRVQLHADAGLWSFLSGKAATHRIVVRRRGLVSGSVIKQLCLNMDLPVSVDNGKHGPIVSHLQLQRSRENSKWSRFTDKLRKLSLGHTQKKDRHTTLYLKSPADARYLSQHYDALIESMEKEDAGKSVFLVDVIAELQLKEAQASESKSVAESYPFYMQGAMHLAVSQRLLRDPLISRIQDQL